VGVSLCDFYRNRGCVHCCANRTVDYAATQFAMATADGCAARSASTQARTGAGRKSNAKTVNGVSCLLHPARCRAVSDPLADLRNGWAAIAWSQRELATIARKVDLRYIQRRGEPSRCKLNSAAVYSGRSPLKSGKVGKDRAPVKSLATTSCKNQLHNIK
jgi:hypothetical protein